MTNDRVKLLFKKLLIWLILGAFAYAFSIEVRLGGRLDNHISHINEKLAEIGERLSGIEVLLRGKLK